jgi:hypothetical protein
MWSDQIGLWDVVKQNCYEVEFACRLLHSLTRLRPNNSSQNTIKENRETLLEATRNIGPEINAEKTNYMIMSRHPNLGQN